MDQPLPQSQDHLADNETPGDDTDDRLAELVMQWEQRVAAGQHPSLADVCSECPELMSDLEMCLKQLRRMDQFLSAERPATKVSGPSANTSPQNFPDIPGYQVFEEIGRGGMGVIYKARQESLNRLVAIKTLPGSRWGQSGVVARLRQEANGLSKLSHPNIVNVFDVVETPAAVSIILEYIAGESLATQLSRGAMTPAEAAKLSLELSRTLIFVHERGLLHRDIKPSNILISSTGELKLADFGLVKEQGSHSSLTETGDLFGTPSYMPPEQVHGKDACVDVRMDLYALGATLYEMLTGRPPFVGVSTLDILNQVQHRDPVAIRLLNPLVPRDLETICLKCLEKDPQLRFSSARELAEEIERFQQGLPIRSRPVGMVVRCRRWCRRKPVIAALTGFSIAAIAVIVGILTAYNRELARLNMDLDHAANSAKALQRTAEERERQAYDSLYAADINRAAIAWHQTDTRGVMTLLERHRPRPGETDRRGFAWWFLYRQASLDHKPLLQTGAPQYYLAHSPDGRMLAVAGADSTLRLLNVATGQIDRQLDTSQMEVNGIAFRPDGQEIATSGDDGTIRVWNLADLAERLTIKAHPRKAFQLAYTPDGNQLILCGDDPVIRVFNAENGELAYTLEGHEKTVQCLLLDQEGKTLISAGNDHTVRVWDLEKRKQDWSYRSSADVGTVTLDHRRQRLIIGNAVGQLQTIAIRQKDPAISVSHLDKVAVVALHPDGLLLASADSGGQIRLRQLNPQGEFSETSFRPWQAHDGAIYSLVWSRDGSQLISTGKDGRVLSWNTATIQSASQEVPDLAIRSQSSLIPWTTRCLAKLHDRLVCWDWQQRRVLAKSEGNRIFHPTVSADGNIFAAVLIPDADRTDDRLAVYQFPTRTGMPLDSDPQSTWEPGGSLQNLQFSPDSKAIAVSRWYMAPDEIVEDHTIWVIRVPNLDQAERIPVPFARNAVYSPDGKTLAITTQTGLVLWSMTENRILWTAPNSYILASSFSPDGELLAFAGNDRMIFLLNASDGTIRFQLTGHRDAVRTLSFTPDSKMLATGTDDAVKFWHVANGQELLEIPHPNAEMRHLEFSSDGDHLICQIRGPNGSEKLLVFDGSRTPDQALRKEDERQHPTR